MALRKIGRATPCKRRLPFCPHLHSDTPRKASFLLHTHVCGLLHIGLGLRQPPMSSEQRQSRAYHSPVRLMIQFLFADIHN
jgi:hypothetical protein